MVAIVTIEYFNKCAEEFVVDVSEYKSFKHFSKDYRSFVNRCNFDGAGTDLVFLSAYFKLHNFDNESRAISTKNISQVYYELEEDDYTEYDECSECDCQCEDEPDELDEIDDKLYFIDEKLDIILDKLDKKEKKEESKQSKRKTLLENK